MIKILNESLEIHDTLNPKIWNEYKLRPEVEQRIYKIVDEFIKFIEVPIYVLDVHILGSNASYNYTEDSDLDIHIIANFDMIEASEVLLQELYNAKKSSFNDTYDISIHGIDVELYVEDVKVNTISNGIYSLYSGEWIKYPEKIEAQYPNIDRELNKVIGLINNAVTLSNLDELKSIIDNLYLCRKNSLATEGEYGIGNLVFKEIRNNGYLDLLKDKIHELVSQELSLESKKGKEI